MKTLKSNLSYSSEMVADQPGFSLSFYALFIALVFGMSFRLTFSEDKVKSEIEKASAKIHPELVFQIQSAQVSLSDGFLPEVAIVVRGISTESEKKCWGRPKIELDELKLPLSFSELLSGHFNFDRVVLGQLRLELRSAPEGPCEEKSTSAEPSSKTDLKLPASETFSKASRDRGRIDSVQIQRLQLIYGPLQQAEIELRRVRLDVQSHRPQKILLRSQVNFTGSALAAEFSSLANLELLFSESESVSFNLSGAWREGSYKADALYDLKQKNLRLTASADHLPLSSLTIFFQNYGWIDWSFKGVQGWASFKLDYSSSKVRIRDLLLDGDLGEIRSPEFDYDVVTKKMKPVEIQVSGLSLDKLVAALSQKLEKSPYFGKLGLFNGLIKLDSAQDFEVIGDHSGLEFIFSNRGRRAVQIISAMSGFAKKNSQGWFLEVNRIRPQEGVFEGRLRAKSDASLDRVELDLKVDDLVLSPAIQELMTSGGAVQGIESQMKMDIHEGKLKTLRGDFILHGLSTEGLNVDDLELSFSPVQEGFQGRVRMRGVSLFSQSRIGEIVSTQFDQKILATDLTFSEGRAQFKSHSFRDLSWSDFVLTGKAVKVQSKGAWAQDGLLSGQITFENSSAGTSKIKKTFILSGSRELPVVDSVEEPSENEEGNL
jgi:hypothetical protein